MKEIEVKSVPTIFRKGGKQCYQLFPKNAKNMKAEEFLQVFAHALGKSRADARYILDVHGQSVASLLAENKSVNTGTLRCFLAIGGSVSDPGATLSKEENPVMACFVPTGDLKNALADLVAINVTKAIEAILYTVQYDGSDSLNTIEGTDATVATGVGLKLNEENADEGVWLEDGDGTAVSEKAAITKNDTNLLIFRFAELPVSGQYTLVIATRDGGSAEDFGITRITRKVIVK